MEGKPTHGLKVHTAWLSLEWPWLRRTGRDVQASGCYSAGDEGSASRVLNSLGDCYCHNQSPEYASRALLHGTLALWEGH